MYRINNPLIFSTHLGGPFSSFANFSPHGFRLSGMRWPTVEHFLLAQMFAGTPLAEEIRLTPAVIDARRLATGAGPPQVSWEQVQRDWLDTAVRAKFRAHPSLTGLLLATGTRTLIEQPPRRLSDERGPVVSQNDLGWSLMRVRTTLRRSAAQKRRSPP